MSEGSAHPLQERSGLPRELRGPLERFAQDGWEAHASYDGLARFWRSIHRQLKAEAGELETLMKSFLEGGHDARTFAAGFGPAMGMHVNHLHMHHEVEDRVYFPRFRSLDPRLGAGLDLLEADHEVIHHGLVATVESANSLIRAIRAGGDPRPAADLHAARADRLLRLLVRHLDDEEEIVVPVMLEHDIAA